MNDYGLGDVLKRCTQAVGIKPCKGCEERAEKLNTWGRRSFVGRIITAAVGLFVAPKVLDAATTENNFQAVRLLRFLNTAQHLNREYEGRFLDVPRLMTSRAVADLTNVQGADENGMGAFITTLAYNVPEILPGWTLEFKQTETTYSAHVKSTTSSRAFSTDHSGVISEIVPMVGWFRGFFFKCTGAGCGSGFQPGCCCTYPCCDLTCCSDTYYLGYCNCGCDCCRWCTLNRCGSGGM